MLCLPENERGQGLVENAQILVLVAIVVVMGPMIGSIFSRITKGLRNWKTNRAKIVCSTFAVNRR